ncbi:MAG: glycosyltransferase family 1 protein [Patescibacteria group bacterium]
MRIGIDARFYGPVGKGLGRYTQEVVDNIIKISGAESTALAPGDDFSYVIFLSAANFDEFTAVDGRVKKVRLDCPWYSLSEQLWMPYLLWREKLDLIHFPHFNVPILTPAKFIVTIHDLILTRFPTTRATTRGRLMYSLKDAAYRLVIWSALRRSAKIITVSEFSRMDIVTRFKIAPEKIAVTYEGVANLAKGRDSLFVAKLDNQETLAQYHIPRNFLLYVGNAYPHKNLEALLRVFARLHSQQTDLRLVLVGKLDYFYERIQGEARALNLWQRGNLNSPVIFPGYVPDAQLQIMYAEARAYVFPSLYEGFGLPPLEAMAQNCPVVSSDRASLPEILGEAAAYFNPTDEDAMLSQIKAVLENEALRTELKKRGLDQAKKYNWWQCAHETLAVYRTALRAR